MLTCGKGWHVHRGGILFTTQTIVDEQGDTSAWDEFGTSCVVALVASIEALAAFESVSVAAFVLRAHTIFSGSSSTAIAAL